MDEHHSQSAKGADRRFTPMVLACVSALWMCGCQSSGLLKWPGADSSRLVRTSADEVRVSGDEDESASTTTVLKENVAANYGSLQSRFEGSTTNAAPQKPGHAFLQPRARLGRPIPLPQQVATPSEQASLLSEERDPHDSAHTNRMTAPSGRRTDTAPSKGSTPWIPGSPAWQPQTSSSEENSKSPTVKAKPSSGGGDKAALRMRTWPDEQTSGTEADVEAAGEPIPNGAVQPIPGDTEAADEADMLTEEADAVMPDAAPENSMLGRLRSFYPPRLDAGTDRIRKQFRRFPDPFGILKEREPAAADSETATVEVPSAANGTAVSAEAEGPVLDANSLPENASPATPVDAAIRQLEEELAAWPRTGSGQPERIDEWRRRQTDLRLMMMVAGRTAESIRMIESLPVDEQEYWQSMMLSMNHFRDSDPTTPRRADLTEALSHLRTAGRRLQPLAALEIQRLMFCSRIDGFGRVTQFPTADFEPGQRILLYAGLRNFRSELTADGKFRTEFAAEIEFRRVGDDEVMETIRLPQILDECDEERTDYYQSFELTAPALAGDYVVRLKLLDQLSLQTAQSELQLSIH